MSNELTKLAYSPSQAVKLLPVGTTTLYSMMNSGRLRYKQVGGRRVISADELRKVFCDVDAPEGEAA